MLFDPAQDPTWHPRPIPVLFHPHYLIINRLVKPPPSADLMTFTRYLFVLCCLSDPQGAAQIAGDAGDQPVPFLEQARQAGLAEGAGEGFFAWVRSCRVNAAAYVHICSQEGGGMVGTQDGSTGSGLGTLLPDYAVDRDGLWPDPRQEAPISGPYAFS